MRRFGYAAGSGALAHKPHDLRTSDGLMAHSREHGAMATLAAVGERGVKPNAPKQSVALVAHPVTGEEYVRLAKDTPKDPRTLKQQEADAWVRQAGIGDPLPRTR